MSIDRETFERSTDEELEGLSGTTHVLGFLATNEDRAFKASEVTDRTGLDPGTVSTALTRLKERDLVEHKGPYWAITGDRDRLDEHESYARATRMFNEQFGSEERSEWEAHAPDEPHPSLTESDG